MIEQLTRTHDQAIDSLSQHEVDLRFDEAVLELIGLNSMLDRKDLQADVIADLKVRQSKLLHNLLEHPAAAVHHEFELLRRLYEGRTRISNDSLGTTTTEFVTRDAARQQADLHFREMTYASGNVERIIEVPSREADGLPFFAITRGEELTLECVVYKRGRYDHVEVDPSNETGQHLMTQLLTHSITASDLVYNRLPDEAAEADAQAKRLLTAKSLAQTAL